MIISPITEVKVRFKEEQADVILISPTIIVLMDDGLLNSNSLWKQLD